MVGLSQEEAAARLKADGPNALPEPDRRDFGRIVIDTLREPMFALLLAAAAIYLALGDLTEAALLAVFATVSVSISVVQEFRSERVLAALRASGRGWQTRVNALVREAVTKEKI